MSADVWLDAYTGGPEPAVVAEFNLTYNLTPMLRAAGFCGWRELLGQTAAASAPMLRAIRTSLIEQPARFEAMNPENGWGNRELAVDVITAMIAATEAHPNAVWGGWL